MMLFVLTHFSVQFLTIGVTKYANVCYFLLDRRDSLYMIFSF